MPSPIGHALGGIAVGSALSGRTRWGMLAIFALAGAVADVDFLLPLQHRGPSHSLGAAALVFATSLAVTRQARMALAIAAAYASHTLLDWLGADSSSPHGLMALWPLSTTYYVSGLDLFSAVSRRYWLPGFWRSIGLAVLREVLILGPIAAISTHRILGRSSGRGDRQAPSA